ARALKHPSQTERRLHYSNLQLYSNLRFKPRPGIWEGGREFRSRWGDRRDGGVRSRGPVRDSKIRSHPVRFAKVDSMRVSCCGSGPQLRGPARGLQRAPPEAVSIPLWLV